MLTQEQTKNAGFVQECLELEKEYRQALRDAGFSSEGDTTKHSLQRAGGRRSCSSPRHTSGIAWKVRAGF